MTEQEKKDIQKTLATVSNALLKASRIAGYGREYDSVKPLPLHMRYTLLCITEFYKEYKNDFDLDYGNFMKNLNIPNKDDIYKRTMRKMIVGISKA